MTATARRGKWHFQNSAIPNEFLGTAAVACTLVLSQAFPPALSAPVYKLPST